MKRGTKTHIAQSAGVSLAFISLIVSGKKRPSWKVAKRLSQIVPLSKPETWLEGSPSEIDKAITTSFLKRKDKTTEY